MTDHANEDHGTHPRLDELRARMATGEVDTLMVAFTDMQGRLMGKRVTAAAFLDGVIDHGAHVCTYLLGTDMEMSTPDGFALMNWETGYGDYAIAPDWETLRVLPWQDRTALVLGDVVDEDSGAEVAVSPRTILKRQIAAAAGPGHAHQGGLGVRVLPADRLLRGGGPEGLRRASTGSASTTRTTTCSRRPRRSPSTAGCGG